MSGRTDVAEFEWHAFKLSKCPSTFNELDSEFSVHMRISGDWTSRLFDRISKQSENCKPQVKQYGDNWIIDMDTSSSDRQRKNVCVKHFPALHVDGPYGSPNEDAFRYPVNISVAAGIGISPFAAVLNELRQTSCKRHINFKMKRMYLIWTCRHVKDFTWFLDLMTDTMKHLTELNLPDLLVCHLYVTRNTAATIYDMPVVDKKLRWFQKRLHFGRPDFKNLFGEIALSHHKQRIGVFYCGPKPLARTLYDSCTATNVQGNTFIFHNESFA